MRPETIYKRVIVLAGAAVKIRAEARRFIVRETGGVLVGYVDRNASLVVVDASGPGPRGRRGTCCVDIDGKAATEFCERWRKESDGQIDYVGDWHTHLSYRIVTSTLDLDAMETMKAFTASANYPPISLIIARFSFSQKCFSLSNGVLVPVRLEDGPTSGGEAAP